MKSFNETLSRLGLSTKEALIYETLLRGGTQGVSSLSRITSLYRPDVYTALASLIRRKFIVKHTKNKRTQYKVLDPHVLAVESEKICKDVSDALPSLISMFKKNSGVFSIKHYEGRVGIGEMFMDIPSSLNRGDTFYKIGSEYDLKEVDSYVPKEYRPKRDAKQLKRLTIINKSAGDQKKLRLEREMKYFPSKSDDFKQNIVEFIYGNKLSIMDFNTETGIIIESPALAANQRAVFLELYKRLT